ncbi:MAG: glycosyltransferase family 2 protein [Hydrogenothermaceae bacterium]|nr:glycosyltransferase family 2 protein [Hydrogenothermaceae bacterium]
MEKISAVILTKNEELNIERAIKSLKDLADEIIVIDSGSTDKTVDLATSLGAKVYFRRWDSFANQRNFGIEKSLCNWILMVDADEEVSSELKLNIKQELLNPKYQAYEIPRRTYYLGKFLRYTWYPEWRLRLFKKGILRFEGDLHETPVFLDKNIKVGKLKGDLYHYSYRNLYHQYIKTIDYAKTMAESYHKNGKKFKLYKLILSPFMMFFKNYFLKLGFLDGYRGFFVAMSSFFYVFLKYLFLYEIELKEKYKDKLWK